MNINHQRQSIKTAKNNSRAVVHVACLWHTIKTRSRVCVPFVILNPLLFVSFSICAAEASAVEGELVGKCFNFRSNYKLTVKHTFVVQVIAK